MNKGKGSSCWGSTRGEIELLQRNNKEIKMRKVVVKK
jgi:hypothetical protein